MFRRLLLGLALVLPAVPSSAQESLLDVVLKRDKLLVATYSTSPPLAYVDDNGKLVGFEIDMAREIAKDLLGDRKKSSSSSCSRTGAFRRHSAAKVDFGLCSTPFTPIERYAFAFTRPYLDTGGSVIARQRRRDQACQRAERPQNSTYAILNVPPAINRASWFCLR